MAANRVAAHTGHASPLIRELTVLCAKAELLLTLDVILQLSVEDQLSADQMVGVTAVAIATRPDILCYMHRVIAELSLLYGVRLVQDEDLVTQEVDDTI